MNEPADFSTKPQPEPQPDPPEFLSRTLKAALKEDEEEEILPGIKNLFEGTVPKDAHHFGEYKGTQYPKHLLSEENWHSMYGAMESEATYNWMKSSGDFKDRKNLIISRSTFPGSGRYNQHWLGDNESNWTNIRFGVAGVYNFNLF